MDMFTFGKDATQRFKDISTNMLKKQVEAQRKYFESNKFLTRVKNDLPWKDKSNLLNLSIEEEIKPHVMPYYFLAERFFEELKNEDIGNGFLDFWSVLKNLVTGYRLSNGNLLADFFMSDPVKKNRIIRKIIRLFDILFYFHANKSKKNIDVSSNDSLWYAFNMRKVNRYGNMFDHIKAVTNTAQLNKVFSGIVELASIIFHHLFVNTCEELKADYVSMRSNLLMIATKFLTDHKYSIICNLAKANKPEIDGMLNMINVNSLDVSFDKFNARLMREIEGECNDPSVVVKQINSSILMMIKHLKKENNQHPIAKFLNFFLYFDHVIYTKNGFKDIKDWDDDIIGLILKQIPNEIPKEVLLCHLLLTQMAYMHEIERFVRFDVIVKKNTFSFGSTSMRNHDSAGLSKISFISFKSGFFS